MLPFLSEVGKAFLAQEKAGVNKINIQDDYEVNRYYQILSGGIDYICRRQREQEFKALPFCLKLKLDPLCFTDEKQSHQDKFFAELQKLFEIKLSKDDISFICESLAKDDAENKTINGELIMPFKPELNPGFVDVSRELRESGYVLFPTYCQLSYPSFLKNLMNSECEINESRAQELYEFCKSQHLIEKNHSVPFLMSQTDIEKINELLSPLKDKREYTVLKDQFFSLAEKSLRLTVKKNEKTQGTILGGVSTPFIGKPELFAQHLYFMYLFHRDDALDFGDDINLNLETQRHAKIAMMFFNGLFQDMPGDSKRQLFYKENRLKKYSSYVDYDIEHNQLVWKDGAEPEFLFQDSMKQFLVNMKKVCSNNSDLDCFLADHIEYMTAVDNELALSKYKNQELVKCSESKYASCRSRFSAIYQSQSLAFILNKLDPSPVSVDLSRSMALLVCYLNDVFSGIDEIKKGVFSNLLGREVYRLIKFDLQNKKEKVSVFSNINKYFQPALDSCMQKVNGEYELYEAAKHQYFLDADCHSLFEEQDSLSNLSVEDIDQKIDMIKQDHNHKLQLRAFSELERKKQEFEYQKKIDALTGIKKTIIYEKWLAGYVAMEYFSVISEYSRHCRKSQKNEVLDQAKDGGDKSVKGGKTNEKREGREMIGQMLAVGLLSRS